MLLQGPTWMPAALCVFALALTVCFQLWMRPFNLPESRWIFAGLFGGLFASLVAPNPWISAYLLTSALSIPVSVSAFRRKRSPR